MKVNVIIEQNTEGKYFTYIDNNDLDFGLNGYGETVDDAKKDILLAYDEMKELYAEENKSIPELEFEYRFDVASFLEYYAKVLSMAGLERLTGVAQDQLSHYVTGRRKPSPKTVKKMEKSLHDFADEIKQIQFI